MPFLNKKEDEIKDSFNRVKQDIDSLRYDLVIMTGTLEELRQQLLDLCGVVEKIVQKPVQNPLISNPAHNPANTTFRQIIPAHKELFRAQNTQNKHISTGNEGVPADRQTNQQADNQPKNPYQGPLEKASEIIDSLDYIREDIKKRFKKLTDQEWLVFSTIYQQEDEQGFTNYFNLSTKLGLTESSIRDYVARLIKKGIPVDKTKINNKEIKLNISQSLRRISSLASLLSLKDL